MNKILSVLILNYKIIWRIVVNINLTNLMLNGFLSNFFTKFGTILIALALLMLMITIHELGHYTAGKLLKFKINEFAIGFGKSIFSKTTKSGEKFSVRLIPLGGFCAFEGEDEDSDNPLAFNAQAPWKRLVVLFSGALFNFVSAIIFSVALLAVVGSGIPEVTSVEGPNSAVLFETDIVLKVDGVRPSFLNGGFSQLTQHVEEGEQATLTIKRDGEVLDVIVYKNHRITIPADAENGVEEQEVVIFGVTTKFLDYSFGESLLKAVPFTFEMAGDFIAILGKLVIGQFGLRDIGGPITTINVIANASAVSLLNLLLLLPLISVNLAVFNLLPIPALDGARMVFVLIEMVRGKPINRELEGKIHMIGLLFLFSLVILVDVLQLLVF